jgi:YHS domain-containing protein
MKKENAKCKCCDTETSGQNCQLAAYTTVIDGKMYTFCCQTRANQYKQKETKSK